MILANEMTKPCTEFDLGFDKGISIAVESHKEDFLHLVRQLAETRQRCCGNGGQHLRTKEFEYFLKKTVSTGSHDISQDALTSYTMASALAIRPATAGAWTTSRWAPLRLDQKVRMCISN